MGRPPSWQPRAADAAHLDKLSRVYSHQTWDLYDVLDQSLAPRGPDYMHEVAGSYLAPGARILDAGCRDAAHLIRLVQAHDGYGVGVDPVAGHVERAREAVAAARLSSRVTIVPGTVELLDYPDESFDLVWCRDVLEQVSALAAALLGCARLLRTGGRMLAYTSLATKRLQPAEAEMLAKHLGNVPANLSASHLEGAFAAAGLVVVQRHVIGTEWREYAEERTHPVSGALLRLARLRRVPPQVLAGYPDEILRHVEANLHWELFQFLGKLEPVLYVLRRS